MGIIYIKYKNIWLYNITENRRERSTAQYIIPSDRSTTQHQIGVNDPQTIYHSEWSTHNTTKNGVNNPQLDISFRVIDPQHTIKSEWTIHKQHKMQRELLSNRQKNTRATHSHRPSENRCSVNPDQRNRPGRKKQTYLGLGNAKRYIIQLGRPTWQWTTII